jgi:hypothetical protein
MKSGSRRQGWSDRCWGSKAHSNKSPAAASTSVRISSTWRSADSERLVADDEEDQTEPVWRHVLSSSDK